MVGSDKQKPLLVCYCYRPPSATVDWADKIEQSIETTNTEQKEIVLVGDINFNLLSQSSSTKAWLEMTI